MPSFQLYHDVPGIEEYESCLSTGPQWVNIDPSLDLMDSQEDYNSSHAWYTQQRLHGLQQSINGYHHFHILQIPEENVSRLGIQSQWSSDSPDLYRHMRYLSPGCAYGATSATDSTTSEEAYSPDAIRQYPAISRVPSMSHHAYSSPSAEGSYTTGNGSWMTPTLHSNAPSSSPYAPRDHSACNLKELQYSHDEELDEDRPSATSHQPPFLNQPEELAFADEGLGRSIGDEDSLKDSSDDEDEEPQNSDIDSDYDPSQKRKHSYSSTSRVAGRTSPRRTRSLQSHSTSITSPTLSPHNRITKPAHSTTKSAGKPRPTSSKSGKKLLTTTATTTKHFPCTFSPYGCPAVFASKNEWKRHVSSQHLQLGFWRCDAGFCKVDTNSGGSGNGRAHNDFNRKDLFTQHWRRMHLSGGFQGGKYESASSAVKQGFEREMVQVRERCWVDRREGPRRGECQVCGKGFNGEGAWEEGMECLGRHFERGEGKEGFKLGEDEALTEWAVREGVVRDLEGRGRWLAGVEPSEGGEQNNESDRVGRRMNVAVAVVVTDEDEDDEDEY